MTTSDQVRTHTDIPSFGSALFTPLVMAPRESTLVIITTKTYYVTSVTFVESAFLINSCAEIVHLVESQDIDMKIITKVEVVETPTHGIPVHMLAHCLQPKRTVTPIRQVWHSDTATMYYGWQVCSVAYVLD